jgi:uncharacterized protein
MPGSLLTWYSLRDLETFAARQIVLGEEIELRRLSRLVGLLNADAGSVKASLRFRQRDGALALTLHYETTVQLLCQRCLEPFDTGIADTVELTIVTTEAMEQHVPQGTEPLVLDEGRLLPAQLIEDELIVSIPFVPKHARIEDCGSLTRDLGDQART